MGFVMLFLLISGAIVIGTMIITIYNNLVMLKNNVRKCWSNIDVILKQRHDEIPKLVVVCQQYMQYEQETFQKITAARSMVSQALSDKNIGGLVLAEKQLQSSMGNLFAVAESYPALKANDNFVALQKRISELESIISDRRREYNEAVNNLNTRVEQFPDKIIAEGRFFQAKLLEIEKSDKSDADVAILFKEG